MDIDQLYTVDAHEAGAEMQVKDQAGKLLDMWITIAGLDSKAYRAAESEMQKEIRDGKDVEAAKVDAVTKISIGWRGFTSEGAEIPFSKEAIEKLYANAPYILQQADRFLANRVNFIKS